MRQRAAAWSVVSLRAMSRHAPASYSYRAPLALIPAQALPPFVPPLQKAKDLLGGLFNQKGDQ